MELFYISRNMLKSTSSTTTSFSVISPQSYLSPKHFLGDLFSHNMYDKLTTLHFWYDYICRFRVSNTFGFENKLQNHWHEGFSESKFNANDSNQNPSKIFPPYYDLLIGWLTALDFYLFYRKHIRCHSVHYHPIQSM